MKYKKIYYAAFCLLLALLTTEATEIHEATRNGDAEKLRHLLRSLPAGAANTTIARDITALHIAAAMNNKEIASILISSGADIDSRTRNGFTPLHWAAGRDAVECVELLIKMDADVNAEAKQKITPLHRAASNNATNTIHLLTANGANMTASTQKGFSPIHWAMQKEAEDACILLAYRMVNADITPEPPLGVKIDTESIGANLLTENKSPAMDSSDAKQSSPILQPFRMPLKKSNMTVPLGKGEQLDFVWIEALDMWFGKYEVTNGQYYRFNPNHDSGFRNAFTLNGHKQPVVMLNWTQAKKFADWLNENFQKSLPDGYAFRLPTEEEWVTVAKCGDKRTYPWGDKWPPEYGNYSDRTAKGSFPSDWQGLNDYTDNYAVTCPVNLSGRNEWKVYGLAGNVWEWCENWYDAAKRYRSRRGASWDFDKKSSIRIDSRGFDKPDARCPTIGFRLVVGRKLEDS